MPQTTKRISIGAATICAAALVTYFLLADPAAGNGSTNTPSAAGPDGPSSQATGLADKPAALSLDVDGQAQTDNRFLSDGDRAVVNPVEEGAKEGESEVRIWRLGQPLPPELAPWEHMPRNLPLSDPADFEQKYEGFNQEQLSQAHQSVSRELQERKNAALLERYNSGQFVVRQPNQEIDLNYDGIADPQLGVQLTSSTTYPFHAGYSGMSSDGVAEVKVVWLPWTEYPGIYHLKDERNWLTTAKKSDGD